MAQIFLFTGENTHAIRTERRRWTAEFTEKHGSENLSRLDGAGLAYRTLLDEIGVLPFIAEKRLVVVSGIPRFEKEQVEQLPDLIHPSCILLFVDPAPDKRLSGVKALLTMASVKTFPVLSGKALRDWTIGHAKVLGSVLDPDGADALIDLVGDDQDMLAGEVEKLSLLRVDRVTREHVTRLGVPSGDREVWLLMNEIATGDASRALRYARALQAHGEDPVSLWNILLWIVRSIGALSLAAAEGHTNPAKAAVAAGVPFPTARTLLGFASHLDRRKVYALVDWAANTDIAFKTGGFKATIDARQEVQALIDECVIRCCSGGVMTPLSP